MSDQTDTDFSPTQLKRPVELYSEQAKFAHIQISDRQPFKLGAEKLHALPIEMPVPAPQRLNAQTGALDRDPFSMNSQQNKLFGNAQSSLMEGNVSVKLLSTYNVELIVDQSLSMRRRDCPGGLSRWEWAGLQARDLATQLVRYSPRGFSLTTFSSRYDVYDKATPDDVQNLFDNPQFSRGTRLSRPLTVRLDNYFSNRRPGFKPLLIAVITDGVPAPFTEPDLVAQTLIEATQMMKDPHEVSIVFFQIGGADPFGKRFLNAMDNDLVNNGAKFDCVHTISFEQLQQDGLARSLVRSVQELAAQNKRRAIGNGRFP